MSRTSTRPDGDFGAYDDDYRGFEPREGEEARGPLILALAIGVLLVFGAVVWNTYKQGVRGEAGALPVVLADASPYKREPIDPGGVDAPDQNRRLYDQLDGSVRADPVGLELNPDRGLIGGPPIELRPGQETDIDEETGLPRGLDEEFARLENLDNLPDAVDAPAQEAFVSTPLAPVTAPEPALATGPRFSFDSSGGFLVQVAALRTQQAADAAWDKNVAAHAGLYAGAEKRVQRADLGAKGVFYRLRVGAFADRVTASGFCDELKKRGETCIVVSG